MSVCMSVCLSVMVLAGGLMSMSSCIFSLVVIALITSSKSVSVHREMQGSGLSTTKCNPLVSGKPDTPNRYM